MQYDRHTIEKVTFKNAPDDTPEVTVKYTAVGGEEDRVKEAKDTFYELPHARFIEAWQNLLTYWKEHIEIVIGDVDWNLHDARVTTVRPEMMGGIAQSVRYWVTVRTVDDEAVTIATPEVAVSAEEAAAIADLKEAVVEYLGGARAQGSLFENTSDLTDEDNIQTN